MAHDPYAEILELQKQYRRERDAALKGFQASRQQARRLTRDEHVTNAWMDAWTVTWVRMVLPK